MLRDSRTATRTVFGLWACLPGWYIKHSFGSESFHSFEPISERYGTVTRVWLLEPFRLSGVLKRPIHPRRHPPRECIVACWRRRREYRSPQNNKSNRLLPGERRWSTTKKYVCGKTGTIRDWSLLGKSEPSAREKAAAELRKLRKVIK